MCALGHTLQKRARQDSCLLEELGSSLSHADSCAKECLLDVEWIERAQKNPRCEGPYIYRDWDREVSVVGSKTLRGLPGGKNRLAEGWCIVSASNVCVEA